MNKELVIVIIFGLVVIAGVFVYIHLGQKGTYPPGEDVSLTLPQATGNINDAAASILDELTADEAFLADEYADADLINLDEAAVNDFGQIANPNEF